MQYHLVSDYGKIGHFLGIFSFSWIYKPVIYEILVQIAELSG